MIKRKWPDKNAAIYICAFFLPFLMVQIFWAILGIYPFGDNSILTGDMNLEFVNFYGYFINTFKSKSDWSYMFAKTLGGDFPGLAAFQLHDPLLFILFLFPGDRIVAGIQLVFTLQVSLAGLSMSILLNKRFKKSWISLLFSTAYAFAGFFFGYLVLTIYFGCLALLPLLVYFFLRYLDDKKYLIPYVLLTVLYIYINFHMGFMLVIFLCILYVSRIIADTKYSKRAVDFVLSGVTILLMDGFFLIRTGLSLLGEKTTEGADYGFYRRFPMNQLFAGFFSGCARNELMPLIYCSVAAVFFALIYLMAGKVSPREKLADIFVIAVIAISMWINTLDAVWHGFNNPEGFYFRYAFFVSFMVVVMGYRGALALFLSDDTDAQADEKAAGRKMIWPAAAACIMFGYIIWLKISGNVYLDTLRLVINVLLTLLTLVSVLLMLKGKRMGTWAAALLAIISMGDMLYNSRTAYVSLNPNNDTPTAMSQFRDDYRNIDDVISYIKGQDDGLYRIEKDFDRAVNDPALFDYIGMSHDSSCEKDEVIDWLNNFGFPRTVYYTYYNGGGTSFVDSFFGIKYYVSRFDEVAKPYERLSYEGRYYAYKNEYALPMAYIAPDGLADYDFSEGDVFEKQNRIAAYWETDDPIYKEAEADITLDGAEETGTGLFRKKEEKGYIIYNVKITENAPLYIYFSAPKRQGAELFINGEDRGRYFSENHWNIMCAGSYKPGDNVEVRLELLEDEIEVNKPSFYYEDKEAVSAWSGKAADLNNAIGEVNEIKSSHLVFNVNTEETERVLVSIPYEKSWKVTCDGRRINTLAAFNMLQSFEVPAGSHTIEMKYIPRGTAAGLAVSLAGLIMLVVLCIRTYGHFDINRSE